MSDLPSIKPDQPNRRTTMHVTCYSRPGIWSSVDVEYCDDCGSRNILDACEKNARCGDCGSKNVMYRCIYTGAVGLWCVDCDGDTGTAMVIPHQLERPCPKCGGE